MANKLEFESTDWSKAIEQDKERIIEDIASQFAKENPELMGKAAIVEQEEVIKTRIRQSVMTRNDLTLQEQEDAVTTILGQLTGYGVLHEFFTPGQKVTLLGTETGGRIIVDAEDITEIFINPSKDGPRVFCSYRGRSWQSEKQYFKNNNDVLRYCQRICESTGRPFTEDASIVDAWLSDGSRLAAVGFKTSPLGVVATIRKSPLTRPPMPMSQLVAFEMLPEFAANLIADLLVKGRANIGVYGDEAIVDMSQICRTMNRNNPDRAILGEIRGKEIVAASQMASSTSGGFWASGHAGGIRDLRTRTFGMFLEAGIQLPMEFLDEIIASMFDFVIFLDKETKTEKRLRTLMDIVQVTENGYRTNFTFIYGYMLVPANKKVIMVFYTTLRSKIIKGKIKVIAKVISWR